MASKKSFTLLVATGTTPFIVVVPTISENHCRMSDISFKILTQQLFLSIFTFILGGRVLEIGFGMGISGTQIETHPVKEHVVIECNEEVFKRLEKFAETAPNKVTPMKGYLMLKTTFARNFTKKLKGLLVINTIFHFSYR